MSNSFERHEKLSRAMFLMANTSKVKFDLWQELCNQVNNVCEKLAQVERERDSTQARLEEAEKLLAWLHEEMMDNIGSFSPSYDAELKQSVGLFLTADDYKGEKLNVKN